MPDPKGLPVVICGFRADGSLHSVLLDNSDRIEVAELTHPLLDGNIDSDTIVRVPVLGDMIAGRDQGAGVIRWQALPVGSLGQVLTVQADGSLAYVTPSSGDPWVADANTWSYSSADAPTFVISINADMTAKISVGMRIRLTQTTVKYFIVTAVGAFAAGATLITVYGGTDYTLANAAISVTSYSPAKAPFGFPMSPLKWQVETLSTGNCTKASPTSATWYGDAGLTPTGPNIAIPIGCWSVEWMATLDALKNAATIVSCLGTLSTASNSESDPDFTAFVYLADVVGNKDMIGPVSKRKTLLLASKTTYYLNIETLTATMGSISIDGGSAKTVVRAICEYL